MKKEHTNRMLASEREAGCGSFGKRVCGVGEIWDWFGSGRIGCDGVGGHIFELALWRAGVGIRTHSARVPRCCVLKILPAKGRGSVLNYELGV